MWTASGSSLSMCEGDYGRAIPVTVNGADFAEGDGVRIAIKTAVNGSTLVEKLFHDIEDNTVELILTEAETARLPAGSYVYTLDWYQDGAFLCNIIPSGKFKVVDKA